MPRIQLGFFEPPYSRVTLNPGPWPDLVLGQFRYVEQPVPALHHLLSPHPRDVGGGGATFLHPEVGKSSEIDQV